MKELVKNIDARTIREAGLFLALAGALYIIYVVMTNDVAHLESSVVSHNDSVVEIRQATNEVLRNLTRVIEGNTKVLENINR